MKTVFLFSGHGSHHFQMGRELYERDMAFRAAMRRADCIVREHGSVSVLDRLFETGRTAADPFDRLLLTHPAIFMVEYALAQTLAQCGIHPDLVLGASLGAMSAATVAGCIDHDEALLGVLAQAGAIEANCEQGGMVTVLGERSRYLTPELLQLCEVGASHFETHAVLSLPACHLDPVEGHLRRVGLAFQRLPVRVAFHSRWIDAAREACGGRVASPRFVRGEVPVVCSVEAARREQLPHGYFWDAVRQPIHFQQTIEALESQGSHRYVDLSPAGSLATLLKHALGPGSGSQVHRILSPAGGDMERLDEVVGQLRPGTSPPRMRRPATAGHTHDHTKSHGAMESRHMKAMLFPGQGAQFKGMGKDVFASFPDKVEQASDILGYSLEALCLNDAQGLLSKTQYTQPALYVVNALHYLRQQAENPDAGAAFLAGHSLGEYNALFAAGVFSFEDGLRLVKKRGELMGAAVGGGMAAVLGAPLEDIRAVLEECALTQIDVANYNTPSQTVIAGAKEALAVAEAAFARRNLRFVPLNVSAAFHSRHMQPAQAEFARFLEGFAFAPPTIPVIANVTARPYDPQRIAETLARQIASPVRWVDSIRYLMGKSEVEFQEIGATVLTRMVQEIKAKATPLVDEPEAPPAPAATAAGVAATSVATAVAAMVPGVPFRVDAASLGSKVFRQRYGLRYAYTAGAMYRGVASADLVIKMGRGGFLSFFGAGGLSLQRIEAAIQTIQAALSAGQPYGMNLLADYEYPAREEAAVALYLKYGVRNVEAAAFMQMTPALVRFRLAGLRRGGDGRVLCEHRVMAKVSRPEVARAFMSPAPEQIVQRLLERGLVTAEQAALAREVPVSHDVCVEADSGGHTDGGIAAVMLPPLLRMRDQLQREQGYAEPICMGLAGGIGGPEAAAAAFLLGADFVTTGSINQCTVESGMSEDGKAMLQEMDIHDTEYAPAGDMFEIGAQVQVMKKSVFFPSRANKLLSLYRHYASLEDIPPRTRHQLETTFFKKSFEDIWQETANYFRSVQLDHEIAKAEANAKHKMALVFRWYFAHCTRLAMEGKGEDRVNYQIQTGPAMGSFNRWVQGTGLEPWTQRHVDHIAVKLMNATAEHLSQSYARFAGS